MAQIAVLVKGAVDLANALGTSGSGKLEMPGRTISWSFQGTIKGIKWKYMGVSVDSKTGETVTVFKNSRAGAVEHCIQELIQRLQAKGQF